MGQMQQGASVRRYQSLRLWFGVPALLAGTGVGVLTNIATSNPTWPVVTGLVAAVTVTVVLSVRQAARDEQERLRGLREVRAQVLESLRPVPRAPEEHTISSLLAATSALARFVAREREKQEVLAWCLDPARPALRVLAGPGGVGKSRLAAEVAGELPEPWAAGRVVTGCVDEVWGAVLACGDPTLIVVDDADTEPDVVGLVRQVIAQGGGQQQIKLLVVVRDREAFGTWLRKQLPEELALRWPTTDLQVIGGAGDRRRWFVQAARAYAAALEVPPPPVTDLDTRPVGVDGEPMVVTQARAVLAALGRGSKPQADAVRTGGTNGVAAELVEHEQKRWNRAALRWGLLDMTEEVREEALLTLVLLAPTTTEDGVHTLKQVRHFGDQHETVLLNVVAWAHHLYPGVALPQVEPTPDFLAGALLARVAESEHCGLVDAVNLGLAAQRDAQVLPRLVRAAALFPAVAGLIEKVLAAVAGGCF